MLGLIASTAGKRPTVPMEFWDSQHVLEGWQALAQNPACFTDISKVLAPFRALALHSQLLHQVKPPFSLENFPTLKHFEKYVRRAVKEFATDSEMECFRQNLLTLKASLHKSHRKILNSEAGRRMAWERNLIPTSATLLVVPDPLVEHWAEQIYRHLNRSLFAANKSGTSPNNDEGRGVIYIDGIGDIAHAQRPFGVMKKYDSYPLPPPWELSQYMIVITSFSRCEREARRLASASTLTTGKRKRHGDEDDDIFHLESGGGNLNFGLCSSLLQMRWLRVCVDEGHELGTHEGGNGMARFIHQIAAERRWVLSGTPTTGDEDDISYTAKALDQLQRLFFFLRHPTYGSLPPSSSVASPYVYDWDRALGRAKTRGKALKEKAKSTWVANVKDPFLRKRPEGRAELLKVLRSVVVMHRKEDLNLHKPRFVQSDVEVPIPEQKQAEIRHNPLSSATLLHDYLR
jgi:SNF2-related domain